MRELKGYIMIMGAAVFWGLSATAAKVLFSQQVDTVLLVQCRVTFSSLLLLIIYAAFRPALLRVKVRDLWRFALLGILGVAGANFTYYFAIRESTVATAILVQYTAPLAVMGFAGLTGEEEFTPLKIAAAGVSLLGCFLAVGGYTDLEATPIGLLSAVGAMFSFAFMNIYTRRLLARHNLWTTTFYSIASASVFWQFVNPPWKVVEQSPSAGVWLALFGLAIVSVLIPHTLFFAGLRHVVASRAVITSTLEPIVAIFSAALVLGEYLKPVQVVGAVLVIVAIVLLQLRRETTEQISLVPSKDGKRV